jgi:hypothetical protein
MLTPIPANTDPARTIGPADMATDAWRAVSPQLAAHPGAAVAGRPIGSVDAGTCADSSRPIVARVPATFRLLQRPPGERSRDIQSCELGVRTCSCGVRENHSGDGVRTIRGPLTKIIGGQSDERHRLHPRGRIRGGTQQSPQPERSLWLGCPAHWPAPRLRSARAATRGPVLPEKDRYSTRMVGAHENLDDRRSRR